METMGCSKELFSPSTTQYFMYKMVCVMRFVADSTDI